MNLKQRLQNRCHLLISATQQLLTDLEQIKFAEDPRVAEDLKQKFIKYFTKNILIPVKNLQTSLQQKTDDEVSKAQAEIMQKIVAYLFQFCERRLRAGQCKNHCNHFELLLHAARNQLDRKLNELSALASLMPLRSEEKAADAKVEKEAFVLQQQQDSSDNDQHFLTALTNTTQWSRTVKANVSVFISYAWPSDDRPWEKWTQPFLQTLKKHLEMSGITVYMDLYDSRYGFNSYHHMDKIDTCDYVILVGTESLQDKFYRGVSAVCHELNMIRKRREQDADKRVFSVIPLIINGTLRTALPLEYERFTVIESFMGGSYQKTINELLAKLYNVSPGFPDFARAWEGCKLISTSNAVSSSSSSSSFSELSPNIKVEKNSYLEKLKVVYQDKAFSGVQRLFDDEVMSIEDYYVNLALIKEEEQKKKEQTQKDNKITENDVINRDEATELLGSAEQFFSVQEPIELKNIFERKLGEKVRQTNRLLIIGRAGIGKTTLCQYIVNQWSLGKLWSERYQAIFRIPLRNLISNRYRAERDYSLVEIINRECFADQLTINQQRQLEDLLNNHRKNCLIILDGYDELSTQAEDSYLVNQVESLLQYPEVIVTSRPQSINFAADKKLEILGFTDENIERYVEHFFQENEQTKTNLKKQLKQQSLLKSLAHIPLNLELICSAWQKDNWTEELSLSELYQDLVEWLTYRYLKKFHPIYKQSQQQQALENLTASHKEKLCEVWLKHLEEIAWQMRQAGEIYINKKELFSTENDLQKREESIKQLRESGLLRQTSDKQSYYFSHLTFQEFFAARHAARIIQNAGSQGNAEYESFQQFFKENKFNPQLQIVWWFIAGLLKDDSKALDRYFHLLLQEPRDITVVGELPLFMHCLEQSDLARESRIGKLIFEAVSERVLLVLTLKNGEFIKAHENIQNQLILCSKLLEYKILPGLDKLLKNSDLAVQSCAADALGKFGKNASNPEFVIKSLLEALKDSNSDVKRRAADALARFSKKSSSPEMIIKALLGILKDFDSFVRIRAFYALVKLVEKTSNQEVIIHALLEALKNFTGRMAKRTVDALVRVGEKTSNLEVITKGLLEALKDSNPKARNRAIDTLGKLGKKMSNVEVIIKALLHGLQDFEPYVRSNAAERLGNLYEKVASNPTVTTALLDLLKDSNESVRNHAVSALGKLGKKVSNPKIIIEALLEMLKDSDSKVRSCAAYKLGRCRSDEKVSNVEVIMDALLEAIKDSDLDVRWSAANALISLGNNVSNMEIIIKALLKTINDSESDVRRRSAYMLGRLSGEVSNVEVILKVLLEAMKDSNSDVRCSAVHALGWLSERSSDMEVILKALLEAMKDSNFDVRCCAADALGWLSERSSDMEVILRALLEALKDSNSDVRCEAANVLASLGEKASNTDVIKALLEALKDSHSNVKNAAADALVSLGETALNSGFIKDLLQTLKDSDSGVKCNVAYVLGRLSEKVSESEVMIKALLEGMKHSDSVIKYLDYLMQKIPEKVIPCLTQSLQGFQKDLKDAVIKYLMDKHDRFEFVNVLVKANKLIFFINKKDKVTIELPVNTLQQLVTAVRERNKEKFKLTSFLLSQKNLISTPLMQAASEGNLQQVQNLLAENADTRCLNQTGMMAVNHAYDHPATLKVLIENHQPIELLFLETILSELNLYHDDVNNKSENEVLLNKLVMLLTGIENISQKKQEQRKCLLAHFQSFGNNSSQGLEGLIGQEFLALHTRHLLQLLAEVNQGKYNDQFEKNQRQKIISYLKCELLITVQAFHFNVLSNIANSKNSNELRESVAKALLNALGNLAHGEELIYQTGYTQHSIGHCVYVAFSRINDQLVVRVDNLWEPDIKNRHELSDLSHHTRKEKYKSYFIGCFSHANLQSNKDLLNYLIGIIAAKELLPSEALTKLYPMVKQNSALALNYLNQWPAKRVQIVGNCVVRSFFVGTHVRLGKKLHHLFRSWESNLLTNASDVNSLNVSSSSSYVDTQRSISSTNTILHGEVTQRSVPIVALTSHEELMRIMARELNLDYQRDIFLGSMIEQTLVDLTGINVQQNNPSYRRNTEDQSTKFYLNFPDEKSKQAFIDFYQTNYSGIILRVLTEQNKTRIDFDTLRLIQEVIPQMKQCLQAKKVSVQKTSQSHSDAQLMSTQGKFASKTQKSESTTSEKTENTRLSK